jgi:CRP/FNR family transcriptional regulator, cyclic AMP receptor protein
MSLLKRSRPLGDLPRFGDLSQAEMRKVREAGREVHVPQGWSLLNESTPPDQAYLVIDGTLEVVHHGKRVAQLGRGDIVGEIGIATHRLRTGTVTALTSLEMLHLTQQAFQKLYDDIPAFRAAVDETVQSRLDELTVKDAE